ncbi:bifunctional DNA primase/polymerase [Streptomyces sp. 8N706]|uniref:bifunctional DNA primase/polymerase n=1 Tax=Streptomyces sp. 8N706 TaxID=3457416 RepID=UPI003FD36951
MNHWQRDARHSDSHRRPGLCAARAAEPRPAAAHVTSAGAQWLASADPFPRSVLALWTEHPTAPGVLPCGTTFDVLNVPAVFGRRMLDRLWAEGPGSGPVSVHRARMLLFAAPGTAQRLPALLEWGEGSEAVPPFLYHGAGDAVTVPPSAGPSPGVPRRSTERGPSRWLVAPEVRHPWLPGTEVLLWAIVHAARSDGGGADDRRRTAEPALAPG